MASGEINICFLFRWIRYNIRASVMCAIRAMGTVEHLAWTPSVCQPAGCMQGVHQFFSEKTAAHPALHLYPTCTAIYPLPQPLPPAQTTATHPLLHPSAHTQQG